MSELQDLYQELILDHNAHPRNVGVIDGCTHHAEGVNPLCGDTLKLFLDVKDGVIRDAKFQGAGCAISTASTSLMTQTLKGKTTAEATSVLAAFHALLTGDGGPPPNPELLGKLLAFAGVREYPSRVKCATLAWHTLDAALHHKGEPVSTE
ncbi:MAG: SUF system NifU family Fe-S cluster assembly protein [Deltaproteobacteria bacterium]|nr:SUF system NifU family Fe-S cluster assembly protein [Deltaproteobacteria bacterium]